MDWGSNSRWLGAGSCGRDGAQQWPEEQGGVLHRQGASEAAHKAAQGAIHAPNTSWVQGLNPG